MYQSFFSLSCLPFENGPDSRRPACLHETAALRELRAELAAALLTGKGVCALTGPAGSGKTLLVRAMIAEELRHARTVLVRIPKRGEIDLAREIQKRFGVTDAPPMQGGNRTSIDDADGAKVCNQIPAEQDAEWLAGLQHHLAEGTGNGPALLILESAEHLSESAMEALRALIRAGAEGELSLSILLVGGPELRSALMRLTDSERIAVFVLPPMTMVESIAYIGTRLAAAGAYDGLFDEDAIEYVASRAGGIPGRIHAICEAALQAAFLQRARHITRDMVEQATSASGRTVHRDTATAHVERLTARLQEALRRAEAYGLIGGDPYDACRLRAELDDHEHGTPGQTEALLNRLEQTAAHLEQRETALIAQVARCEAMESRLNGLLDAALSRADDARRGLDDGVDRANAATVHAIQTRRRLEDVSTAAGAAIEEISSAATLAEDKIQRLDSHGAAAGSILTRLHEEHVACASLVDRLRQSASDIAQRASIADVQMAAAAARMEATAQAVSQAQDIAGQIERMMEQARGLETAIAGGIVEAQTRQTKRGKTLHTDAETAATSVHRREAAESGERSIAQLLNVIAGAEQKQQALQTACVEAHELLDALNARQGQLVQMATSINERAHDTAVAQIEIRGIIGNLHEKVERSERLREELEKQADRTEAVVQITRALAPEAEQIAEKLRQAEEAGEERAAKLIVLTGRTEALLERLSALEAPLREASATGDRLLTGIEQAQALGDQLDTWSRRAEGQLAAFDRSIGAAQQALGANELLKHDVAELVEVLNEARGAASDVHGRLDDVMREGADLAARLADYVEEMRANLDVGRELVDRIVEHEGSLQAGERLIRGFTAQSEKLSTHLTRMEKRTAEVESRLTELAERPGQVMAQAREQSEQLERVAGAVRKVLAALSKMSLDANRHAQEFARAGAEAQERIGALKQETQQATYTLGEWVAEATRAQQRLAWVLGQVPTIEQTHPVGQMYRGMVTQGEDRMMPIPAAGDGATVGGQRSTEGDARPGYPASRITGTTAGSGPLNNAAYRGTLERVGKPRSSGGRNETELPTAAGGTTTAARPENPEQAARLRTEELVAILEDARRKSRGNP